MTDALSNSVSFPKETDDVFMVNGGLLISKPSVAKSCIYLKA